MGYRLRMHNEIRDGLTGMRATEPELARLVGEAVLALLDVGESLRPPLVLPLESVLQEPDDPREALDFSYQRQLEALTQVRRGVADVATSRKRVELQVNQVEHQIAKLTRQREVALDAGQESVASEALSREAALREQLAELRRQYGKLTGEEERLTVASQRLQAKVEAFRMRKETLKATYTAAEASQRIRAAFAEMDMDAADTEAEVVSWYAPPGPAEGTAEAGELLEDIQEPEAATPEDDPGPDEDQGVSPPPGLLVLRAGAPDDERAGLLFLVEPQDTAVLLAYVANPGGSHDEYRAVLPAATARLEALRAVQPPGASPADFTSYDQESFLDEFFPGEETEVEIGANTLVARNRAHTLAEAREQMRLTQAHVAERMHVRPDRVAAIERAEPGATEVRTLAAYVRALGGTLEIIAHIGGERITLK
jgi:DNA-binding XRE family transcriptional regulator